MIYNPFMDASSTGAGHAAPSGSPVVVAAIGKILILDHGGERHTLAPAEAAKALADGPAPVLCHAPTVTASLGAKPFPVADVLELFAFVRPARFCLPTIGGLAASLGLEAPDDLAAEADCLQESARLLLEELADPASDAPVDEDTAMVARTMQEGGWPWGDKVVAALARRGGKDCAPSALGGLDVWHGLNQWAEYAPEPQPNDQPVDEAEARERLAALLGGHAEPRPQQSDYASASAAAFHPREHSGAPNFVIADAGTGVGKTLGYIAPASLWAERNHGPVWISTFTRNLQRQIDGELDRLFPDPKIKARRVVIRKGRENYLCLLNLEDTVGRAMRSGGTGRVALGLMARWVANSRSGDVIGGDFPTWLADLVGWRDTLGLTDRRGECIYSACEHYSKCFIERTVRQARRAEIVVANHALVMTQAALGGLDDLSAPTRLVFDEGHHVFHAADSAFSAELSGQQGAELRRWLLGAEGGGNSRARGLARRIDDIAAMDDATFEALTEIQVVARALPSQGWLARIEGGRPNGAAETFLARLRDQVYARARDAATGYGIECDTEPLADGLGEAANALSAALIDLAGPMKALIKRLAALLDEQAADMDSQLRHRIEAVGRGLARRTENEVGAWASMLASLNEETPAEYVDWFSVRRSAGRDTDAAMHRHWIDPTIPFARTVATPAHGVLVTSATLRDGTGDMEADWLAAEQATGALHLNQPARRAQVPSPFDYPDQTRVLAITDIDRGSADQVAASYRELFLAAGGGGLGLFTAISRLRAIHDRINAPLADAGVRLHAQHVDSLDTASLIDIFRAEVDSCILGTDAIRDGVDVPGRSLRLVVFDRVPWPRPDILHRARRKAFGGRHYDDMIARLRLKQAYGRLVRRADDRGVFVMLDQRLPSRLSGAFPEGVEIRRLGLADAVAEIKDFLLPRDTGAP